MNIFQTVLVFFFAVVFLNAFAFGQTRRLGAKTRPAVTSQNINHTPQEIAQSGSFDGRVYANKLLGFSVSLPNSWSFASEDANKTTLALGREKIKEAGESAELKQEMDKSISNTRVLFQASPLPLGQPGNSAVLACGFEKLQVPQTQQAYSEFNKNLAIKSSKGQLKRDLYSKTIGGKTFTAFEVESVQNGLSVKQTYLVANHKNLMFFLILTMLDDGHKTTMDDALQTLRFSK